MKQKHNPESGVKVDQLKIEIGQWYMNPVRLYVNKGRKVGLVISVMI